MSLDYPEYEALRKKSKFLALLWIIGDRGYYLGLVTGLVLPLALIYTQFTRQQGHTPWYMSLLSGAICVAFCFCIVWGSKELKNFALKRGKALKTKS
jgi:magnesium-transporting ATPase (P-type)